ncbi:MAG TPA: sulfite exporter TauE/SafE family protein [Candidatus Acidoferrales bacterium]|nr:sulfite exporter TauE/SafE family protein [Candidatus Acidoferrales bacterium]
MHIDSLHWVLVILASVVAGAMNAVAGGGTLLAFPTLLFVGVPSIPANATTSLGLWPSSVASGWLYRKDIDVPGQALALLSMVSVAGGFLGAWLLLHTPQRIFDLLVPVLLLFAAAIFTASERIRLLAGRLSIPGGRLLALAVAGQFAIGIYGGYFGAAMGVLMLALFSLTLASTIHSMNGVRSICGMAINGMAVVVFIAGHRIDWRIAAVMALASVGGASAGTVYMRRLDPAPARRVVLALAWGMTLAFVARVAAGHLR